MSETQETQRKYDWRVETIRIDALKPLLEELDEQGWEIEQWITAEPGKVTLVGRKARPGQVFSIPSPFS